MSEEKNLKERIKHTGTWDALYIICDAISELKKEIFNLRIKIEQNRGYSTEIKKQIKKENIKVIQPDKNAIFYKNHYNENWNKLCPVCSGILITKDNLYKCHNCNETFQEYLTKENE